MCEQVGRGFGWAVLLVLGCLASVQAEEAVAFVTEAAEGAGIVRAGGNRDAAAPGSQLWAGDELQAGKGRAVLVYLSGRSVAVEPGRTHAVRKEGVEASALVGRIKDALGEIASTQEEAGPVVHGMARAVAGIKGALPANTRVSRKDFSFTWDALEGVSEYGFALESSGGKVLVDQVVKGTQLGAGDLPLAPGQRYFWSVQEKAAFMARSSGKGWVEVLPAPEAEELGRSMQELEQGYTGSTQVLMKAALLFKLGCYYEVEQLLVGRPSLAESEQRILRRAYAKMERWDRVQGMEKKEVH